MLAFAGGGAGLFSAVIAGWVNGGQGLDAGTGDATERAMTERR